MQRDHFKNMKILKPKSKIYDRSKVFLSGSTFTMFEKDLFLDHWNVCCNRISLYRHHDLFQEIKN